MQSATPFRAKTSALKSPPVKEHSLTADFNTKGSLILINAQGQLVEKKQNIEGKQVLPIKLRTGFYRAQLRTEKGVAVVKIVLERL